MKLFSKPLFITIQPSIKARIKNYSSKLNNFAKHFIRKIQAFFRYYAFFFWRYIKQLYKEWTFWIFLLLDFVGLIDALTNKGLNITLRTYIIVAITCFLIANNEAIKKKEFLKITKSSKRFIGHTFKVNSISLSTDGKKLVSSSDRMAIIWNLETKHIEQRLQCSTWIGNAFFVNQDQNVIGIGGKGLFFQWKVGSDQPGIEKDLLSTESVALAVNREEKRIATARKDGEILIFDYPSLQEMESLRMGVVEVRKLAFSPVKNELAACDVSGKVCLFDLVNRNCRDIFKHPENEPIRFVDFSPNGERIAFVDGSGYVYCYDLLEDSLYPAAKGHEDMGLCCRFNRNGNFIASGGQDNQVILWKVKSNRLVKLFSISSHTDAITSLAFEMKSNNLYSSSRDAKIMYWNIDSLLAS